MVLNSTNSIKALTVFVVTLFAGYIMALFLYTVIVGGDRVARIDHVYKVQYDLCVKRNSQVEALNHSMQILRDSDNAITVAAAQDLARADSSDPAVRFARDDIAGIRKRIDAYQQILNAYQPVNCKQSVYGGNP